MVQYYSIKHKTYVPQLSPVCETRKVTAETISKCLGYVTKGHIRSNANNIVLNLKQLYSLAP